MARLILGILASLCVGIVVMALLDRFGPDMEEGARRQANMVIATLFGQGAALFWIWVFLREHGLRWTAAFGMESPSALKALGLGGAVGILVLPPGWALMLMSGYVMVYFEMDPVPQLTVEEIRAGVPVVLQIYLALMAIIVAPIAEEKLFRGVLYPAIKERGFRVPALVVTSLLFAVVHANMVSFASLLFLAFIFTLLYERTDNLLAPIAAHAVFNAANFVLLILGQRFFPD